MELRPHLMLEGDTHRHGLRGRDRGLHLPPRGVRDRPRAAHAAIEEFREAGLLDGRSLELVVGAGAYICGEETAMLESMEGRRGMPRLKPPFPSQVGYLGRPTLINNVETLAHVPAILRDWAGNAWPRVRLWSVSGAVREPGCYEAPLDVTPRQLIDEHGGGSNGAISAHRPRRSRERDPAARRPRRASHARFPA